MLGKFMKFDSKVLEYINIHCNNKLFDKTMPIITALGNLGVVWIGIALLLIFKLKDKSLGFMMIFSIILTTIIGEGIIKHIVKRKRPFLNNIEEKILINKPITYSFPSGHTASSFAALYVCIQMDTRLGMIVSPIATLIAFSRLYLKVHYPSDVIFGIVLGCICGNIVVSFFSSVML